LEPVCQETFLAVIRNIRQRPALIAENASDFAKVT
jgi:hypothetical protein